jgi:hypothetical protein
MEEKAKRDRNKDEFAKEKGVSGDTLEEFGVTSRFYKSIEDEDKYTNHAPPPKSEVLSEEIQKMEQWMDEHPEHVPSLQAIVYNASWIIKVSSLLATGDVQQDAALEIPRFRNVLKSCHINLTRKDLTQLAKNTKSFVLIPIEDVDTDGCLFWYLINTLQKMLRAALVDDFDEEDFRQISVGNYSDSDDISEPEPIEQEQEPKEEPQPVVEEPKPVEPSDQGSDYGEGESRKAEAEAEPSPEGEEKPESEPDQNPEGEAE